MPTQDNTRPGHPQGLPPETHNSEQDERGQQAQEVADDARREGSHTSSPLESTKAEAGGFDPAPASKGDLVDEMRRMEASGQIDMGAFAGEPNHDDEPGAYGNDVTDYDGDGWVNADGVELVEASDDDVTDEED